MQIFAKIKISVYAHIWIEIIIFIFKDHTNLKKRRKKQNHNIPFLTKNDINFKINDNSISRHSNNYQQHKKNLFQYN